MTRRDDLVLDIGGTFIKGAVAGEGEYRLLDPIPINQEANCDDIIGLIASVVRENEAGKVTICMPGPMDYQMGICRMKHKFASLYGINLKERLELLCPFSSIRFLHDVAAFTLGEMSQGALENVKFGAGVTLGTGIGFCMCKDGQVLLNDSLRPRHPLWNAQYEDGIVEDQVSGRGIMKRYERISGLKKDVYNICCQARAGDALSIRTMAETGRILGAVLTRHLEGIPVEKIVFGGQIAKSLDVMKESLSATLPVPFEAAMFLQDAALRGCLAFRQGGMASFNIGPDEEV